MTDKLPTADEARALTEKSIAEHATQFIARISDIIHEAARERKYEASIVLADDDRVVADYLVELLRSVHFVASISASSKAAESAILFQWKPVKK